MLARNFNNIIELSIHYLHHWDFTPLKEKLRRYYFGLLLYGKEIILHIQSLKKISLVRSVLPRGQITQMNLIS